MTDLAEKRTFWQVEVTRREDVKGTVQLTFDSFGEVLTYVERYSDVAKIVITKSGLTP